MLEAAPGGGTTVRLAVAFSGLGAAFTAFFAETITRDYLKLEAEGLKGACESGRREARRARPASG